MVMIGSVEHGVLGIAVESLGVSALLLNTVQPLSTRAARVRGPEAGVKVNQKQWCCVSICSHGRASVTACSHLHSLPQLGSCFLGCPCFSTLPHPHLPGAVLLRTRVLPWLPPMSFSPSLVTFYASLLCSQTLGLWLRPTSSHYLQCTFLPFPQPHFILFFLLIIYCLGVILLSFHSWTLSKQFVHGKQSSWLWLFISINFAFLSLTLVSYPLDNFDT